MNTWIIDRCDNEIFYITKIGDSLNELQVKLENRDETKQLTIKFTDHISYRISDEGDRLLTLKKCPEICSNHTFFKTLKSDYIDWFNNESLNIRSDDGIVHFLIVTPNEIFEILSINGKPNIELVQSLK